MVLGGLIAGCFAWWGASTEHLGVDLPKLLAAGLNAAVPALCVLGAGALVFGLRPRLCGPVVYGLVAWSFLVDLLGSVIKGQDWVRDTSLFSHIKLAPAVSPDWGTAAVMLALALLAAASGGTLRDYQVATSDVDQYLGARVRSGQKVRVDIDALDHPGLTGVVRTVALEPTTSSNGVQNYAVTVALPSAPAEVPAQACSRGSHSHPERALIRCAGSPWMSISRSVITSARPTGTQRKPWLFLTFASGDVSTWSGKSLQTGD